MNKKGFTLIELLAVIVILAIILLIAMPIVLNVIEESRRGAFNSTGFGLIKAAENQYMRSALEGEVDNVTYIWDDGVVAPTDLEYSGKGPSSGSLFVQNDGKTAMGISDGTYCAFKALDATDVKTVKLDELADEAEFDETSTCSAYGLYELGDDPEA